MAKKHRRKGNVSGEALRQARLDASVKYSSQGYALSQLLNQAATDYKTQVRIDRGAARGVKASASATIPKVNKDYTQALQFGQQQQGVVNQKLAGLSRAADDIKAASAVEAAGAQRRIGESRANSLSDLRSRISQADAAAAYSISNDRAEYGSKRSQIQGQLLQLSKEKGLFTIAQEAANKKAQQQYNLAIRGQNKTYQASVQNSKRTARTSVQNSKRSAAVSRENSKRTAAAKGKGAGKGAGKGKGRTLTPGQQNAAIDQVNQARSYIAKLEANPKLSSHQIRQTLEQGYSVGAAKGKPGVKIPAFPHDVINAAYDLYANGVLSHPNIAALRRRKVKIPSAWRPSKRRIRIGLGAGTH